MQPNRFITLEGIDGVGKSTHLHTIEAWLLEQGARVKLTREPGGTALGEHLRELLLNPTTDISTDTEILLMFAARAEHINKLILPALKSGYWVISDRFTDATLAYQGGGQGANPARINQIADWVQQGLEPVLTVLIDVPTTITLERLAKNRHLDRFENEGVSFHRKVRDAYLALANDNPKHFVVIDGNRPKDIVKNDIINHLTQRLTLLWHITHGKKMIGSPSHAILQSDPMLGCFMENKASAK